MVRWMLGLLLVAAPAAWPLMAQSGSALPQPVGYVNDFAGVLSPEASARIGALAQQVQAATRGDMVVVTLPDLGGRPVEEVTLRLGREWKVGADAKIGDQARNAGVIILLVPKETSTDGRGHCRIETGQGAEGFITDATSGSICRAATPLFQARQYSAALVQISEAVAARYAEAFGVTLDGAPPVARGRGRESPVRIPWALIFFVLFIVISSMGRRRRGCVGCIPIPIGGPVIRTGSWSGGSGWSGGDFGGSSGGFGGFGGGGGFSGGGGGSDW
ncbi:MAG: TPM domain-containing protein [Gemmatimonadaceae bacterium]|nr:TPM domain-containing protein [Gemmatimonadaceae bacterium]